MRRGRTLITGDMSYLGNGGSLNTGLLVGPKGVSERLGFASRARTKTAQRRKLLVVGWNFFGSALRDLGVVHVGGEAIDVLGLVIAHCLLHGGVHVLAGVVTVS